MDKVIWNEGLFLRPQHLQQQDRYVDFQIRRRLQLLMPYGWGFSQLELDESLLQLGKVAVVRAAGLLPDGTLFDLSDDPDTVLVIERDLEEGDRIFLAVPALVKGSIESHEDGDEGHRARYRVSIQEVANSHGSDLRAVSIATGRLRARLVTERQLAAGDIALQVAQIQERKPDGRLVLSRDFIPPLLSLATAPLLQRQGREILNLVQNRARALAERLQGARGGSVSSVADLLLLQALNRHQSVLGLALGQPQLHPYQLYQQLVELYGDLSALCQASRLAEACAPYDQGDSAAGFGNLFATLRSLLTQVFEQSAVSLPLHRRKFGLSVVPLADMSMLRNSDFIVAIKADLPEDQLTKLVPARIKVGSVGRVRDIINLQLPGCKLTPLATAPRQLPYHAGYCYFKLDAQRDLWADVEQSGGFAIHVSGEIGGLEMEFWSLKR